jgi:hypothetical protein
LKEPEGDLEKNQAPNSSEENLIDPLTIPDEKWWKFLLQVLVPFLILGVGTITAGTMLGNFKVRSDVLSIYFQPQPPTFRNGQFLLKLKRCSFWCRP